MSGASALPAESRPTTEAAARASISTVKVGWPLLLAMLVWLSSCGRGDGPTSDPELRRELGIPSETPIHRVDLSTRSDRIRLLPRAVEVRDGDVVQFVVMDYRTYLVRFDEEAMDPDRVGFLRSTGQDRPPPLVEEGARLVLTFDDAPIGSYFFDVEGGGLLASGAIHVIGDRR